MNSSIDFGNDFIICDNANTNNSSVVGHLEKYKNPKYNKDQESYLKLNGN